jgi:hypothetical protein
VLAIAAHTLCLQVGSGVHQETRPEGVFVREHIETITFLRDAAPAVSTAAVGSASFSSAVVVITVVSTSIVAATLVTCWVLLAGLPSAVGL